MTTHPVDRLVERVRQIRAGAPLRRVTVLVPSHASGRDVLRALGRSGGTANVAVRTPAEAVSELAAPALAPRTALPLPVTAAAVDRALDEAPGHLSEVSSDPVTADSIARAIQRLGSVDIAGVAPETRLHSEVLRLARTAAHRTSPMHYPQHEALRTALDRLDELGEAVLYLPVSATVLDRGLVAALRERGAHEIDHPVAHASEPDSPDAVRGSLVVHASDSDDEVRAVLRLVRRHLSEGVPGHRIGVFHPSEDPYQRLLIRAFSDAGIPARGPGRHPLGSSPAGAALLRLLELDAREMPRAELLSIVAGGAVRVVAPDGTRISPRRCERLTRRTFAVLGGDDWEQLREHSGDDDPGTRDDAAAAGLIALVDDVRAMLDRVDRARTWSELASVLRRFGESMLWPHPELGAGRALSAVDGLTTLDAVAARPHRGRVVSAVRHVLDGISPPVGVDGAGVNFGPLDDAVGRDLDVVCVVGMAEGLLPVLHRPDPLVPEDAVAPPASEQLAERYRVLQHALASARLQAVCSFPRGSMRGGGDRIPSRWLLPTLTALAGRPVAATAWRDADSPDIVAVPSFADGVLSPGPTLGTDPTTPTELRLRRLADSGWDAAVLPAHPGIARAHAMRRDRHTGEFGRFTGDLSSVADLITFLDAPLAPTRLEDWASSPYLFFLSTVLGVRVLDEPAEIDDLDPLNLGTLLHEILRAYVEERITDGAPADRERLSEIAHAEFDRVVDAFPGLIAPLWRRRRAVLNSDLSAWYVRDADDADAGWTPAATELDFGGDGADVPVEVTTTSGPRRLLLKGSIDRLDSGPPGLRVTDYKTGAAPARDDRPTREDPTLSATRFQLPLYAVAAGAGAAEPVAMTRYWYCTERGGFEEVELPVDGDVIDTVLRDLGAVVDAIERGWFPPRGGSGSFRDLSALLGAADLDRTWEQLGSREPFRSHPAFTGIAPASREEEA